MSPPTETRRRLVQAAEEVLHREGVGGLTTKAVARVAGRSEGSIYNHFSDRVDLITAVIDARLPDLIAVLGEQLVPGRRTVAGNLERIGKALIEFDSEMLRVTGGVLSDPELLHRFNAAMRPGDKGPHRPHLAITAYLEAERDLGRLDAAADCTMLAFLFIGGCREAVFQDLFGRSPINRKDAPRRIVSTLVSKELS